MKKIWTIQEENALIRLYDDGISINEISKRMNRSPASINNKLKRKRKFRGFKTRHTAWELEEDNFIRDNYGKLSYLEMSRILENRSENAISIRAFEIIRNKICRNRFSKNFRVKQGYEKNIDETIFEVPNLINSYWAGFLAADGCIHQRGNGMKIGLSLMDKDRYQVELFKDFCKSEHQITTTKKIMEGHVFYQSSIGFSSLKIAEDLKNNFNITPNKTFTLQPPPITEEALIDSYIVGYIDGDGYVKYEKNSYIFDVVGTLKVVSWIRNRCMNILSIYNSKFKYIYKKDNVFSFRVGGKKAKILLEWFNRYSVPKLYRKWGRINSD